MNNACRGSASRYSIAALPLSVNALRNSQESLFLQLARVPLQKTPQEARQGYYPPCFPLILEDYYSTISHMRQPALSERFN